VAALKVN